MLNFHPITLEDRQWMEEIYRAYDLNGSENCFSSNYNWKDVYGIQVARMGDMLAVRSTKGRLSYTHPSGKGEPFPVIEAMMADAREQGAPFRLYGVKEKEREALEAHWPGRFVFFPNRDAWDYIYDAESLATLSGKKLHGKRNHINRFKELYPDWSYEAMTADNMEECRRMNREWCRLYGCEKNDGLAKEACAVRSSFDNFDALGLRGGLLRAGGRVVGFTMGRPLNSDTFIVHIEKAFPDVPGAYPMINQQFVQNACQGFRYINREDDTGDEGLRKAKLSYRPAILLEKYTAVPAEEAAGEGAPQQREGCPAEFLAPEET